MNNQSKNSLQINNTDKESVLSFDDLTRKMHEEYLNSEKGKRETKVCKLSIYVIIFNLILISLMEGYWKIVFIINLFQSDKISYFIINTIENYKQRKTSCKHGVKGGYTLKLCHKCIIEEKQQREKEEHEKLINERKVQLEKIASQRKIQIFEQAKELKKLEIQRLVK